MSFDTLEIVLFGAGLVLISVSTWMIRRLFAGLADMVAEIQRARMGSR